MGTIKTTNIEPIADNGTVALGSSGDTFNIPNGSKINVASGGNITVASGATITNNGTQTGFGGANTPAFHAKLSSTQSVSNDTEQKINVNTEDFDTDNCYDNSTNYRFTPTVAGKYWCYGQTGVYGGDTGRVSVLQTRLKKNGNIVFYNSQDTRNNQHRQISSPIGALIDFNGSSDYLEMHCYISLTSTSGSQITGDSSLTFFGAYKIIT